MCLTLMSSPRLHQLVLYLRYDKKFQCQMTRNHFLLASNVISILLRPGNVSTAWYSFLTGAPCVPVDYYKINGEFHNNSCFDMHYCVVKQNSNSIGQHRNRKLARQPLTIPIIALHTWARDFINIIDKWCGSTKSQSLSNNNIQGASNIIILIPSILAKGVMLNDHEREDKSMLSGYYNNGYVYNTIRQGMFTVINTWKNIWQKEYFSQMEFVLKNLVVDASFFLWSSTYSL